MSTAASRPAMGRVLYFGVAFVLGSYFTYAAVQGDHGLFQRIQINAEVTDLRQTRDRLAAELAWYENRTHRLSDGFLDLDLLDQQARAVLGMIRGDELIIR